MKHCMKKKILVIAPHADDEVLGCGGYLLHQSREGAEIHIAIATIGGTDRLQNIDVRKKEFLEVCQILDATGHCFYENKDAELDSVSHKDLTTKIDNLINEIRPDELFVSFKSRHQDHIKVYNCAMASIRLRVGYNPKFVALYEYPFITGDLQNPVRGGNMFHDISDVINEKVALFKCYKSQVKESPSPLNEGGIKALANYRGLSIGVQYAEMFYVQKMIL